MRHAVSKSTYALVVALMTSMAVAETVERSFEATAGGRFVLDADWGHVEVATWDQETVDVVVEHADHVSGPVVGRTSGGSIHVESAGGPVKARRSGGSIRIGSAAGAVDARTSGGSIRIGSAQGPTIARTSGGSIELASVAGSIEARTSGGSIKATLTGQPDAESSLRTVGGSVTVGLVEGVAVDIDARTTGGRVTAELANLESTRTDRSTLVTAVNGGGPTMTLRTTGGSIRLLNR